MIRFEVHVRPGARRDRVGGSHAGALVVTTRARAVEGAATEAVLVALAGAFQVPRSSVRCLRGQLSRRKFVEIDGDTGALEASHVSLMALSPT